MRCHRKNRKRNADKSGEIDGYQTPVGINVGQPVRIRTLVNGKYERTRSDEYGIFKGRISDKICEVEVWSLLSKGSGKYVSEDLKEYNWTTGEKEITEVPSGGRNIGEKVWFVDFSLNRDGKSKKATIKFQTELKWLLSYEARVRTRLTQRWSSDKPFGPTSENGQWVEHSATFDSEALAERHRKSFEAPFKNPSTLDEDFRRRLPALSAPAADQSSAPLLALLALALVLLWFMTRRFRTADRKRRCSLAALEANLLPEDSLQVD